jgi:hypothetical protein
LLIILQVELVQTIKVMARKNSEILKEVNSYSNQAFHLILIYPFVANVEKQMAKEVDFNWLPYIIRASLNVWSNLASSSLTNCSMKRGSLTSYWWRFGWSQSRRIILIRSRKQASAFLNRRCYHDRPLHTIAITIQNRSLHTIF